jgi:hypothetical protein
MSIIFQCSTHHPDAQQKARLGHSLLWTWRAPAGALVAFYPRACVVLPHPRCPSRLHRLPGIQILRDPARSDPLPSERGRAGIVSRDRRAATYVLGYSAGRIETKDVLHPVQLSLF